MVVAGWKGCKCCTLRRDHEGLKVGFSHVGVFGTWSIYGHSGHGIKNGIGAWGLG